MLNLQQIRDRLGPGFHPFTIYLSDGRMFKVPHPDFIAVGRGIVSLIDEKDTSHHIGAVQIVSLDHPQELNPGEQ